MSTCMAESIVKLSECKTAPIIKHVWGHDGAHNENCLVSAYMAGPIMKSVRKCGWSYDEKYQSVVKSIMKGIRVCGWAYNEKCQSVWLSL